MVTYALGHLTQADDQRVGGPIQDDEALLLFAMIRVMRLKRILEFGGLGGYSARNFLEAVGDEGEVYSVDLNEVPKLAPNHVTIRGDASRLTEVDVGGRPLDLVFFDCHAYEAQMETWRRLSHRGIITDKTVLALHDTNLHPKNLFEPSYAVEDGWRHIETEAKMVNEFKRVGYDVLCFHTQMSSHSDKLPYRWGITICSRFKPLQVRE
jgi:predicted O-methyltransferase YrrM